jgi:hypothetical protein
MKNTARIALASALLLAGTAHAQASWGSLGAYHPLRTMWAVNWEIAGPIGTFGNHFGDTSLRGFSVEGRTFLRDDVSIGFSFSWNRFSQTYGLVTVPIANGENSQSNFGFVASPEAGLLYNVLGGGTSLGINLALRYTVTTAKLGAFETFSRPQPISGIVGVAAEY